MRTAQDVIEKLKQKAPEQSRIYFKWDEYISVRANEWGLILPGYETPDNSDNSAGYFKVRFENSQRIEKTVFCKVKGRRGKFLLLGCWGKWGRKVTIIKASTVNEFGFRGCLISYDPESKTVWFSDENCQPYALVMPIVDNIENVIFGEEARL